MTSSKQRRLTAFEQNGFDRAGRHQDWDKPTEFVRYEPGTGEILETGIMPAAGVAYLAENNGWTYLLQSAQLGRHYVDLSGGTPRRRVRSSCPAQIVGHILSGQPVGSRVTVTDAVGDVTLIGHAGEPVELEFDLPGTYVILVESVPHTDGVYTVEVSP